MRTEPTLHPFRASRLFPSSAPHQHHNNNNYRPARTAEGAEDARRRRERTGAHKGAMRAQREESECICECVFVVLLLTHRSDIRDAAQHHQRLFFLYI